jgi:hypothetical protein
MMMVVCAFDSAQDNQATASNKDREFMREIEKKREGRKGLGE